MKPFGLTIASVLLLGCGSSATPGRELAEPASPSAPAVRFTNEESGGPDVGAVRLQVFEAGRVSLPRGQLAVSDAFINDYPVVVSDLPAGDYAAEVLIAQSTSDHRVAAARVRIRKESIARWRRVGFIAIDSGTGAFFDPRIASSLGSSGVDRFNDSLLKALEASYRHTYSIAEVRWEDMKFIAFSTGFGDGSYPVFLGISEGGLPVAVLVDCEILPWTK